MEARRNQTSLNRYFVCRNSREVLCTYVMTKCTYEQYDAIYQGSVGWRNGDVVAYEAAYDEVMRREIDSLPISWRPTISAYALR